MTVLLGRLWTRDEGQDIAEYAVMLAVILVVALATIRLIGTNASAVFSNVASSIRTSVGGTQAAFFRQSGNEYPIIVRLRQEAEFAKKAAAFFARESR